MSRDPNSGLDPRPATGSPALTTTRATPPGYTTAGYKGAFADRNWATDWTALSAYGILTSQGGWNPVPESGVPVVDVVVSISLAGASVNLSWTGGSPPFTVQKKNDLNSSVWTDVGTTQTRGATVTASGEVAFFRVVSQ